MPTSSHEEARRLIQLTPPGRGAIATVRVEGPAAVEAVGRHFRAGNGRRLSTLPADRLVIGQFGGKDGEPGEEVVVRRCADGAVEVHCHGGRAAIGRIEELLAAIGFQTVPWRDWAADSCGDPFAAEALVGLADACTERTAAILLDQYHGALRRALDEIQEAAAGGRRGVARRQIDVLLGRAELGRHLVQPWRVVFGGPANVGKSTLINALLGYGRSIVHPAPGTTRDAVTALTAIDGWPVELCDTAGLRAEAAPRSDDPLGPVEAQGIRLAQQRLAEADLAVLVFDQSVAWSNNEERLWRQWPGAAVVHNKADLPPAPGPRPAGARVSALEGQGLSALLGLISSRLVPNPPPPGAGVPISEQQLQTIRDQGLGIRD